jgi:hypothetical protein
MSLALWLCPVLAFAQTGIEGPSLGWVWDKTSGNVRQVRGIPGSATLGGAPSAPAALSKEAAADASVLAIGEDGLTYLLRESTWQAADVPAGASRIVLSGRGKSALVMYDGGEARILTGLPEHPHATETARVAPAAAVYAVADDGSVMLAARPDEGTIWVSNPAGHQWKLDLEEAVRSMALVDAGQGVDALIAGDSGVWRIHDVAGNAQRQQLSTEGAIAVAVTRDRQRALAVLSGSNAVVIFELSGAEPPRKIIPPVRATTLAPMARDHVYRLTPAPLSEGPIWMIDLNRKDPLVFFVPPSGE